MSEAIDYKKLAEAIREIAPPAPRVPSDKRLWDVATLAEYLNMSEKQVHTRIICHPDFPPAIRLPTKNGRSESSRAQPRWEAKDVVAWAQRFKSKT